MVTYLQFSSALCIVQKLCSDVRTHTHTDTCTHTQVSTLPPADREHATENMSHQPLEKQAKISAFFKAAHFVDKMKCSDVSFNVQFK